MAREPTRYIWSNDPKAVLYHRLAECNGGGCRPACRSEPLADPDFSIGQRPGVLHLRPCEKCLATEIEAGRSLDWASWVRRVNSLARTGAISARDRAALLQLVRDGWPVAVVNWMYTLWYDDPVVYASKHGAFADQVLDGDPNAYLYRCLRGQLARQRHHQAHPTGGTL